MNQKAFEITYVDATNPHLTKRGKSGQKLLNKQKQVVRAATLSDATKQFFKNQPTYKLMTVIEVAAEPDQAVLAQLAAPKRAKHKAVKSIDPRSVQGFQRYMAANSETQQAA